MPRLQIRKPEDVPVPSRASRAVQEQQRMYEGFIREVGAGDVGELELGQGDQIRSVKVRLRRAASRIGVDLEIWDANQKVYFRSATRRGRRKAS
jgi:hypothetical protein